MSMGGMISQILVANHPDRFHSYTQIASMVSTPNPTNGPSFRVIRLLQERAFKNATKEERIDRAVRLVSTIGMKGYNYNTQEFRNEVGQSIDRSKDDTGFIRQMAAILGTRDRVKKVSNIKIPTLIIHGDIDPLVKPKNAFHSHKLISNSDLLMVENMGHLIEEPVFNKFKDKLIQHLNTNC
jgi:pimeloyl-ACP methyl ester carboxylesterase